MLARVVRCIIHLKKRFLKRERGFGGMFPYDKKI
ncbi:MAG: hypothetical protein JWM14_1307 [Chitinophagaceae bacterium]|nr:hypothetical protein [Chitinophagaceae bacterium]